MAILGLHHVGISTANLERSVAFYCTLFGFEKVFDFEWQPGVEMFDRMMALRGTAARVVMLRTGTSFLEIFEFAAPIPEPQDPNRPVSSYGLNHICITVDDAVAECKRLEALGLRLHCPPIKSELPVTGTYGRDPDGNVIEILQIIDPAHPLNFPKLALAGAPPPTSACALPVIPDGVGRGT
jgi:catechol 2,3-dioxygenase-like lactoylglutathione lyase family enzyme